MYQNDCKHSIGRFNGLKGSERDFLILWIVYKFLKLTTIKEANGLFERPSSMPAPILTRCFVSNARSLIPTRTRGQHWPISAKSPTVVSALSSELVFIVQEVLSKFSWMWFLKATLDGGIGYLIPISEKTFRRLFVLQNALVVMIPHYAGLNPKSYR